MKVNPDIAENKKNVWNGKRRSLEMSKMVRRSAQPGSRGDRIEPAMTTLSPAANRMDHLKIRQLVRADRKRIRQILAACGAFTDEEVRTAMYVLSQGLAGGLDGDYPLFAAELGGRVCGYVCVGKTPLTRGTWHEYWICVHPAAQSRGVGQALQAHAEAFVRSRGGERLVLETSGRPDYARTRRFYRKAGYSRVGRIRDFYKPGDDCVMFAKVLA